MATIYFANQGLHIRLSYARKIPHFHDEHKAREYLESTRWRDGTACPRCSSSKRPYELKGNAHRPGLWKCAGCLKQFTVKTGTILERSKVPLTKWLLAAF